MSLKAQMASLGGFPARIGQLVVSPEAGVARVEAEGGGLRDALWLVVLGVLTFRLPELCRVLFAAAGPISGGLMRLVGLFVDETKEAAWVVLPAAVIVTVAAGSRRDAARDLELGAACYAPFFALRAVARLLLGTTSLALVPAPIIDLFCAMAALFVLAYAIRAARARTPEASATAAKERPDAAATRSPPPANPNRRALLAGLAVLGLSGVALVGNAVWVVGHYETLRPMRQGAQAPAFSLPDVDHAKTITLDQLRGKVVVLDFWATWCSPCVAMLPVMDATHAAWASRGVAFVGLNSDGGGSTPAEIKSFLSTHHIPYPVGIDDGAIGELYKVEALPTLVIIDREGRIRQTFLGYTTQRTLDRALQAATSD